MLKDLKILIGIPTAAKYKAYQDAERKTWIKDVKDADVIFFPGHSINPVDINGLRKSYPSDIASDEIYLDVPDDWDHQSHKTWDMFRWAVDNNYDFFFKADTDTFLIPDRLLNSDFEKYDYSGLNNSNFYCSGGPGYWVSRRAMEEILKINREDFAKIHQAEDIAVGVALRNAGIIPHWESQYIPEWTVGRPQKDNNFISTHHCSPAMMIEFYNKFDGKPDLKITDQIQMCIIRSPDFLLMNLVKSANTPYIMKVAAAAILSQEDSIYKQDLDVIKFKSIWEKNMPDSLVITKLTGGIGNQMFQYAIAKAMAARNKSPLLLDISAFPDPIGCCYTLGCFKINEKTTSEAQIINTRELNFYFDPNILIKNGLVSLAGYWQSEKYFKDQEQLIRDCFEFHRPIDNAWEGKIWNSNSVAVHIRRGEYAESKSTLDFHGLCPIDYYKEAYAVIKAADPEAKFFIFTNDIKWNGLKDFEGELVSIDHGLWNSSTHQRAGQLDMYLMSLCKHHIIANSTFSWWGAWLKKRDGLTIAPKKWFVNGPRWKPEDLFPTSWIIL
jgi:hypothetical protein